LHSSPLMIAEETFKSGNDTISQAQAAMVIDSLHTQEPPSAPPGSEQMVATYYSRRFQGRHTASGERYDRMELTCAHRTLPFNTILKITNPLNNLSVQVRVNDRGPFTRGRHIDLSYAAARELDMLEAGVLPVWVEILTPDSLAYGYVVR